MGTALVLAKSPPRDTRPRKTSSVYHRPSYRPQCASCARVAPRGLYFGALVRLLAGISRCTSRPFGWDFPISLLIPEMAVFAWDFPISFLQEIGASLVVYQQKNNATLF